MTQYIGWNIADSMFEGNCILERIELNANELKGLVNRDTVPVFNKGHEATLKVFNERFNFSFVAPVFPPKIKLAVGDSLICITLRGLPRKIKNYQWSEQEVREARMICAFWKRVR